jgi:two-component system, cell cycle response regulator
MPAAKVIITGETSAMRKLAGVYLPPDAAELHFAATAPQTLEIARRINPDLALIDMQTPGEVGAEACRALKGDESTRAIAILALAAPTDTQQQIRALELGAADFIPHGCHATEFKARFRAALQTQNLMKLVSEQALIDGLTGLHNRRYFDERFPGEIALATRREQSLGCIVADLDGFKNFNEKYGPAMGDEVLRLCGFIFRSNTRTEDLVCRFSSEKFILLLPQTSLCGASMLAERLREAIEAPGLATAVGNRMPVTASFGVSDLHNNGPHDIISAAQRALALAKRYGRNRVQTSSDLEPIVPSEIQ